jgi:hypothetical protein
MSYFSIRSGDVCKPVNRYAGIKEPNSCDADLKMQIGMTVLPFNVMRTGSIIYPYLIFETF